MPGDTTLRDRPPLAYISFGRTKYLRRENTVHVLIVGGGIAGPAAAVALRRAGLTAHVLEARPPADEDAGAFLVLAPNGVNALAAIGLGHVVAAAGGLPLEGIRFTDARGRPIGRLDGSADLARYGARSHLLRRGRLHAELTEAARRSGARIERGARVVAVEEGPYSVLARLADGRGVRGDVLLGADGVRSHVRGLTFPAAPAPSYTGIVDCGGWTPVDLPDTAEQVMVFGRQAFFAYVVRDHVAYWFTNLAEPAEPTRDRSAHDDGAAWLDRIRCAHDDDPAPVRRILAAVTTLGGSWPVHDLPHLPSWHTDRVGLLGDAAHATSPSAGQGASLAVEDAAVVARLLGALDPPAALATFERLRRPRAEAIVALGRRLGNRKTPSARAAWLRNRLLPLFLRMGAAQAAGQYGYRVEDVPVPARRVPGGRS
jgi:2-polyprenyl-6-methoxyphenol hydroxylase-like FAD-dependent oxidoreductase